MLGHIDWKLQTGEILSLQKNSLKKHKKGGETVVSRLVDVRKGNSNLNSPSNICEEREVKFCLVKDNQEGERVKEILLQSKLIAVDCEGLNLGPCGKMTFVPIYPKGSDLAYLFDILLEPNLIIPLREIMESESITLSRLLQ